VGFALFGVTATFAPAIGPTIGGWITDNYSWPWVFFLNLVPGLLFLAAIAYGLDSTPMRLDLLRHGDWSGIAFMAVGLGALTVFLEEGTREDWFGSPMITRLAVTAAIALPVFILIQLFKKRTKPLLNLRLFRRRNFLFGCIVNVALGFGLYGAVYLLPLYLAQIQGYNALQIGETMIWVGLPQLFIMPLVPLCMKFIDKRVLIGLGLTAFGLSCLLMSRLTPDSAHDQLVLPQIVRAFGFPFIMVPLSLITTGGTEQENVASASGLFNMLRNLGGSMGIALLSALLTQREHFHSHHLGEAISLYNPLTRDRIDALVQALTLQNIDPVTAQERAIGMLDGLVRKQAYLLAYNDCFHAMAILLFAAIVLLFFCREVHGGSAAGAH
jgi:DHA2 family multidrug resistance protein